MAHISCGDKIEQGTHEGGVARVGGWLRDGRVKQPLQQALCCICYFETGAKFQRLDMTARRSIKIGSTTAEVVDALNFIRRMNGSVFLKILY